MNNIENSGMEPGFFLYIILPPPREEPLAGSPVIPEVGSLLYLPL
jgi:hypothetical protein